MRRPIKSDKDQCWGGRNWVFESDEQRLWLERMAERGWTAPQWPVEYGGGGLSRQEIKILQDEMARILARRPLDSFGIDMLGPALFKFASEEQKQRLIRADTSSARPAGAQGYSRARRGFRPGQPAVLAPRTRATTSRVNWQSKSLDVRRRSGADWIFCLVRTDPDVPKAGGHQLSADSTWTVARRQHARRSP